MAHSDHSRNNGIQEKHKSKHKANSNLDKADVREKGWMK